MFIASFSEYIHLNFLSSRHPVYIPNNLDQQPVVEWNQRSEL